MTPAAIIRKTVLAELASCSPHPLPVKQLLTQVNGLVRPELKLAELKEQLSWLKDRGMVDFISDELEPEEGDLRRWLITDIGFAMLKR